MRKAGAKVGVAIMGGIVVALAVLNMFGGLVSGIWLAILGEWRVIILGFVFSMVMPWAWTIASLPAMGLAAAVFGGNESPTRAAVATGGFVVAVWNAAMVAAWTLFVFLYFTSHADKGTTMPLLLWGYSTAMAPLAFMASKEPAESTGTSLGLMFAVGAYGLLLVLYLFDAERVTMIWCVGGLGVLVAAFATALGAAMAPPRSVGQEPVDYLDDP